MSVYDYLIKYIIIGNCGVGKSNITMRFLYQKFCDNYVHTIGVEYGAKNIIVDNVDYRIQIWDTAGQENYRSVTRSYYTNCSCAFIVYDVTNNNSFKDIKDWINDCRKYTRSSILYVLIGNKIDLDNERIITYEQGEKYAKNNGMLFFEVSALTGENIDNCFISSIKNISERIKKGLINLSNPNCGIKLGSSMKISINKKNENEIKNNKKICCQ